MTGNIDTTSRQLKQTLEDGKTIIVTTLQKFPVIADQVSALKGKRFAVIIDEAHSSQSGESTKSLKQVLSAKTLDDAEKQDGGVEDDLEDRIVAEMKHRGRLPNVSYFAFTATPKSKTLELFGRKRSDGKFEPFSLYSMRQAIEERFILDVLENYTTYQSYWNLLKKIKDDPHYDREKAEYLLKSFVGLSKHTINKKVAIPDAPLKACVLCESAVDALSCHALHPSARCLSTAGARPDPAWLAALLAQGQPLFCGFDADATGEAMAQAMIAFHPSIRRLRPSRKDWNDVLRAEV